MKKALRVVVALGVVILSASMASALPIGPLQIGDKIFDEFSVTGCDPALVNVTTIGSGVLGDWYGIVIQGPFVSPLGGVADFGLLYSVRTASGQKLITDIEQGFNLTSGGNGGTVSVAETVFGGGFGVQPQIGQSTVGFVLTGDYTDPPAEPIQGDHLILDQGPWAKVYVTKDIFVTGNPEGRAGATIIIQRFSQSIPDGGATVALLGLALTGIGILRRKLA